jgi:hypothetical protein
MNDLEWLGWEVLAARRLFIGHATAIVLGRLVRSSPRPVALERLATLAAASLVNRGPETTNQSVRVHISRLRGALRDLGVHAVITTMSDKQGGYWIDAVSAGRIMKAVSGRQMDIAA